MINYFIDLFKTDLWKFLSDLIISIVFISVFTSIVIESVKNSLTNVYNISNKKLLWFLHLVFNALLSVSFSIILFLFIYKITNIFIIVLYNLLLFISSWGLSFLVYMFLIKWLMLLVSTVNNIFKKLQIKTEKHLILEKAEKLKAEEIFLKLKEIVKRVINE